jgi:hypothetical protein
MELAVIDDELQIDTVEITEAELLAAAMDVEFCDELLDSVASWAESSIHHQVLALRAKLDD